MGLLRKDKNITVEKVLDPNLVIPNKFQFLLCHILLCVLDKILITVNLSILINNIGTIIMMSN